GHLEIYCLWTETGDDVDALALERALQIASHFLVLVRRNIDDNGDFGSELVIDAGKFKTGSTSTTDDHALRQIFAIGCVVTGQNRRAIGLKTGDLARGRAGVNDDIHGLDGLWLCAFLLDLDLIGRKHRAPAFEDVDLGI